MNPVQQAILDRRSNRGFNDAPLTQTEIDNLVDAALASPTACNYQDWHFSFVRSKELLSAFSAEYRAGMLAHTPAEQREKYADYDVFFGAPLVVFITLPKHPRSRYAQVDAGIAVENLALAAQGMGLGSVILGRPKEVFLGENGQAWERKMGFPEGNKFAIAICIGHDPKGKEPHPIAEGRIGFVD